MSNPNHEFTLRDRMTYEKGSRVVIGPEVLTLSLDEAYEMRRKLEEVGEIEKAYKEQRAKTIRDKRKNSLTLAYMRAGVDEAEATKKAEMVVSGNKPKPNVPFKAPKTEKPKSERKARKPAAPATAPPAETQNDDGVGNAPESDDPMGTGGD